jgi:head-tail adaptor
MRTIPTTKYDRLIEVWTEGAGTANALNEAIGSLAKVCDAWASVSNRAAMERTGVSKTEAMTTEVFTVRFCAAHAAIAPKSHTIRFGSRIYNVRAVSIFNVNEAVDIVAEAPADNGI